MSIEDAYKEHAKGTDGSGSGTFTTQHDSAMDIKIEGGGCSAADLEPTPTNWNSWQCKAIDAGIQGNVLNSYLIINGPILGETNAQWLFRAVTQYDIDSRRQHTDDFKAELDVLAAKHQKRLDEMTEKARADLPKNILSNITWIDKVAAPFYCLFGAWLIAFAIKATVYLWLWLYNW